MIDIFLANFISIIFLLFTILLGLSLAEELPADFMNRNYTGETIKPKPAAKSAFITITITFVSMFFVWSVTPLVSQYYDYLYANLLPLLAIWWLLSWFVAVILRELQTEIFRWIVSIGLVAVLGIGFFAPAIKSISLCFLTKPNSLQGIVVEKNSSTSKYGTTYIVKIDDNSYQVTRGAYSEFNIGETVEVFHTEFRNMVFPIHHLNTTWFGIILLIFNSSSVIGALAVIGYSITNKEKQL